MIFYYQFLFIKNAIYFCLSGDLRDPLILSAPRETRIEMADISCVYGGVCINLYYISYTRSAFRRGIVIAVVLPLLLL